MKRKVAEILFENNFCYKDEKGYFFRYKYKTVEEYLELKKQGLPTDRQFTVKYINEDLVIEDRCVKRPLSSLGKRVGLNILLLPDYEDNESCNKRQSCTDLDMFISVLLKLADDNLVPKSDVHIWFEHKIENGKDIVLKRCMCLI